MRRLATVKFWRHQGWRLALVALLGGALFAGALIWRAGRTPQCDSVNKLNDAIVGSLERSKLGLPSNPYFASHPKQLQEQLDEIQQVIDDLNGARC